MAFEFGKLLINLLVSLKISMPSYNKNIAWEGKNTGSIFILQSLNQLKKKQDHYSNQTKKFMIPNIFST